VSSLIKFTSLVIPITKFRKNKVVIPKDVAERVQKELDTGTDLKSMISIKKPDHRQSVLTTETALVESEPALVRI